MKKDERFPSKWLKAVDLKGKAAVVTIDRAEMEVFKNDKGYEEDKLVVYFKNKKKGLICNQTNWDLISQVTGTDDDSSWPDPCPCTHAGGAAAVNKAAPAKAAGQAAGGGNG
jgi:hypothetical protein